MSFLMKGTNIIGDVLNQKIETITYEYYIQHQTEIEASGLMYLVEGDIDAELKAHNVEYSNTTSGLIATDVQGAIDEVKGGVPFKFGINSNGEYGYYKAGADTVTPFKTVPQEVVLYNNGTFDNTLFNTNVLKPPVVSGVTTGFSVNANDITLYAERGSSGSAESNCFHISSLPVPKGHSFIVIDYRHQCTFGAYGATQIRFGVGSSYVQTNTVRTANKIMGAGYGEAGSQNINYYNGSYYWDLRGFIQIDPTLDNYLMIDVYTHNSSKNKVVVKKITMI